MVRCQAFAQLLGEATAYLQARQDQLYAQYDLTRYERYDWDQDTSQLIFSENGQARVVADFQFVGSISTRNRTWLWSWANQSIQESVKRRVRAARTYGDNHILATEGTVHSEKTISGTWPPSAASSGPTTACC